MKLTGNSEKGQYSTLKPTAVSFPAVSKKIRFLSIPKIFFFIGKHFGTGEDHRSREPGGFTYLSISGVILATAFGHLLQDSFEALTSHEVKRTYPGIGKRTGFIILASLLTIFLIEYISTSYVDHLHEDGDSPPDPKSQSEIQDHSHSHSTELPLQPPLSPSKDPNETTPLLSNPNPTTTSNLPQLSRPSSISSLKQLQQHYLSSIVTNSPRHSRSSDHFYIINDVNYHLNNGEYHLVEGAKGPGSCVCVCVCPAAGLPKNDPLRVLSQGLQGIGGGSVSAGVDVEGAGRPRTGRSSGSVSPTRRQQHDIEVQEQRMTVNRNRQIVGILNRFWWLTLTKVLQLGIMIHSLVIGLTLSITSKSEFTIIFHQLFEGLSLGIRIAAIPHLETKEEEDPSSTSSSTTQLKQKPSTLSLASVPSISISHLSHRSFLQPVLTFLFAVTTPFGIGLGMVMFGSRKSGNANSSHMMLVQGLMSAISAGMLIYAATVEMLAGDFVFGNLGGGGGGGHAHAHGHSHGDEFINEEEEDPEAGHSAEGGGKEAREKGRVSRSRDECWLLGVCLVEYNAAPSNLINLV
ncbi:hypothetical protein D9757_005249 [Collybiopsis confluens]|uniref:Uncharacterized protein n=1 Tax=Collybiopsis confluens TaxID=2823264 RepID=A0A8H5HVU1_9AGAR|nr:hypothetical protein D9757_005249 [Collybiopsis confluens]